MYQVYRFNHESRSDMKTIIIEQLPYFKQIPYFEEKKKTNDKNLKTQLLWFETIIMVVCKSVFDQ